VTNLFADAGYAGKPALEIILSFGYVLHVRSCGEEKALLKSNPEFHARRWVVEACHCWINRFRKLLVRFEKKLSS
jgi:transposase